MADEKPEIPISKLAEYISITQGMVSIDDALAELGMENKWAKEQFKAQYSISILKFHKQCRLMRAKELLKIGEKRIGEIATIVGYKNIYTFSEAYKIKYGHAPSKDRKK
jgi:AraC-like DNA-binding protein